ncbi:LysR substrate-binding domain-containing protein [Methylobacterium sp. JK268]
MERRRRLPPLAALRAFEAAARHLSFRRAAEELGVTPTAISHQIRLLEGTLGLPLFARHVRRVALTEAGERLFPVLRDGFDAFGRALAALHPHPRRRIVTLSATMFLTVQRLIPALGVLRARHPDLDLRLHASDEVVDLAGGAVDIAVRYGAGPFAGLVAEPLLAERFGVLASPRLGLAAPADLRHATLLHTEWKRPGMEPDWRRFARHAGLTDLAADEGPRFTEDSHALQAAIAGQGVAVASLVLAAPEIAAGLLVHPFGPVLDGETYHAVATRRSLARDEVRAVQDWLRETLAEGSSGLRSDLERRDP